MLSEPMSAERRAEIREMLERNAYDPVKVHLAATELLAELDRLRGPGGWIRTGKRLPEYGEIVWAMFDSLVIRVSWWGDGWWVMSGNSKLLSMEQVEFWRPVIVPEPPGEGGMKCTD